MKKRINLFDSTMWSKVSWDKAEVHPDLKLTDAQLNIRRGNRLRWEDPEFVASYKEGRKKFSASGKAREAGAVTTPQNHKRRRRVHTPDGVFNSVVLAAEHYGISMASMAEKVRGKNADYWYEGENANVAHKSERTREKGLAQQNKIHTPAGVFDSRRSAAEYYGVHPSVINYRLKTKPKEYWYIETRNPASV